MIAIFEWLFFCSLQKRHGVLGYMGFLFTRHRTEFGRIAGRERLDVVDLDVQSIVLAQSLEMYFMLSSDVSSHVQNFVKRMAIGNHDSFEGQDSIHRDATCLGLSLDIRRVWKVLCLSIASM
jgi:hypothetical protein